MPGLKHLFVGLAGLLALAGPGSAAAAAAASAAPAGSLISSRPDGRTPPRPAVRQAPRPAIWVLADEDTRIYLFGTVHILAPDLVWRSADLDRIVAEADELVLEIGEDPDAVAAADVFGPMRLGKSVPVLSRVSPERRATLRQMIDESGLPMNAYDNMHTWAVAMMLEVMTVARAYARNGVAIEDLTGVEDALRADFARTRRPISGVESSAQQVGFFSAMPLESQRAFLESLVDAYADGDLALDPQELGWVGGDVDSIAAEMAELPPDLFEILITRRNTSWTGWLADRLDRPGTVLFAVGAGHLAGRDSVQSMLASRGFRVTRLNP